MTKTHTVQAGQVYESCAGGKRRIRVVTVHETPARWGKATVETITTGGQSPHRRDISVMRLNAATTRACSTGYRLVQPDESAPTPGRTPMTTTAPETSDDKAFTRPLVKALQQRIEECADTIPGRDAYRIAAAWVYTTAVTAWCEDHGLTPGRLRAGAEPARAKYAAAGGTAAGWLAHTAADLAVHPSLWCWLDPAWGNPIRDATPSEEACQGLIGWWSKEAPDLAHDVTSGPATISGFLIGDLLQLLTDERSKGHALVQSPWWLADGILDRTLIPAAREHRDETLRLIDPSCGTGHMLIRAIGMLWELYTTGNLTPRQMRMDGVTGWTPVPPGEAAARILAGVDGVELDPVTAAVARLRVTVTIAHLLHTAGTLPGPLHLATIPHRIQPRIVVGDSLLAGKVSAAEYARHRPVQAAIINLDTTQLPLPTAGPTTRRTTA
jgi:hypothetical protein